MTSFVIIEEDYELLAKDWSKVVSGESTQKLPATVNSTTPNDNSDVKVCIIWSSCATVRVNYSSIISSEPKWALDAERSRSSKQ